MYFKKKSRVDLRRSRPKFVFFKKKRLKTGVSFRLLECRAWRFRRQRSGGAAVVLKNGRLKAFQRERAIINFFWKNWNENGVFQQIFKNKYYRGNGAVLIKRLRSKTPPFQPAKPKTRPAFQGSACFHSRIYLLIWPFLIFEIYNFVCLIFFNIF